MAKNQQNRSQANPYQSRQQQDRGYITTVHVTFFDVLFAALTAILLTAGSVLAPDPEFRWSGVFVILGGISAASGGVFLHVRHRLLKKKLPAHFSMHVFTSLIVGLSCIGLSNWWFETMRDSSSFNIVAGSSLISVGREAPNTLSRFLAFAPLPGEAVINPLSRLVYLQITNKQARPSKIIGISLEVANNHWWSPWKKLCPVNLLGMLPGFFTDDGLLHLFSSETMLETKIAAGPLAPTGTVEGWTAWECPKTLACEPNQKIRVAVTDAAGVTSWQTNLEPPISPDLQAAGLREIMRVDLKTTKWRRVSACH